MNKKGLLKSLEAEGFSPAIVGAFARVLREDFVREDLKGEAYADTALPLENGATISQPYTIAFMLKLLELEKGQKILEIGSGGGYVLALLSEITRGEIYGVEIIESLAEKSRENLKGCQRVEVIGGNGFRGLKERAPFDRILISAAAGKLPEHLYKQLKKDGVMVVPVGNSIFQIKKKDGLILKEGFGGFIFVPLREIDTKK